MAFHHVITYQWRQHDLLELNSLNCNGLRDISFTSFSYLTILSICLLAHMVDDFDSWNALLANGANMTMTDSICASTPMRSGYS